MSDSWERLKAEDIVRRWKQELRVITGEVAGQDELTSLIEDGLEESYRRGAQEGEYNNG